MKRSTTTIFQITVLLIMMLVLTAFACRQNNAEQDPKIQAEIEAIESETEELDSAKNEIEQATAELDSLLNEIN